MRTHIWTRFAEPEETTEEPNDAALRAEVGGRLTAYLAWLDAVRGR